MFLKNGPNLEGSFLKSAKYYRAFLIFRKIFKSKLKNTAKHRKAQQSSEKHSKAIQTVEEYSKADSLETDTDRILSIVL